MNEEKESKSAVEAPREPTRAQKREIMDLLDEVYDVDAGCYKRGDTDDTIANVLEVMPGWVGKLREEFFGPAGCNEDMAALKGEIEEYIGKAVQVMKTMHELAARLEQEIDASHAYKARLEKIEKAVGPRVLARA